MRKTTLGDYLCDSLIDAGIEKVFGIAGDYNFTILDKIESDHRLDFVESRNELNASYAADGFARLNGIAAMVTTFGVGELSAFNGIAGSYSENVPVIHIVGAPPTIDQKTHRLMHHSLMDGNYKTYKEVYDKITGYAAVITQENAGLEIQKAIHIAKTEKKPVYLTIADDLIAKEIYVDDILFEEFKTNPDSLNQALHHAIQLLTNVNSISLVSDVKVMRFDLKEHVKRLVESMNIPVATTVYGKGSFDEADPHFIGSYDGGAGEPAVNQIIENADCIIAVGLVWADTNTSAFTAKLDFSKTIEIQPTYVKIGSAIYQNIRANDMLDALRNLNIRLNQPIVQPPFPYQNYQFGQTDLLAAENYYPIFEQYLKENDIIAVDTGTLLDGFSQVRLKKDTTYIIQGGYQSIGYATPATFGACIKEPSRRTLLFTGDGSLQMTAQEISSMLMNNCKPIIIILNNGLYLVEMFLNVNTEHQKYNVLPNWSYTKLPEAFGGNAYTATVRTTGELIEALKTADRESKERLCIIEIIPKSPYDVPEYLKRTRVILQEQNKQ